MTTAAGADVRLPRYQALLASIRAGETVQFDGAIGNEPDTRGLLFSSPAGENRLAAVGSPEALIQTHVAYIHAGARVITAHTFGHTRERLEDAAAPCDAMGDAAAPCSGTRGS